MHAFAPVFILIIEIDPAWLTVSDDASPRPTIGTGIVECAHRIALSAVVRIGLQVEIFIELGVTVIVFSIADLIARHEFRGIANGLGFVRCTGPDACALAIGNLNRACLTDGEVLVGLPITIIVFAVGTALAKWDDLFKTGAPFPFLANLLTSLASSLALGAIGSTITVTLFPIFFASTVGVDHPITVVILAVALGLFLRIVLAKLRALASHPDPFGAGLSGA